MPRRGEGPHRHRDGRLRAGLTPPVRDPVTQWIQPDRDGIRQDGPRSPPRPARPPPRARTEDVSEAARLLDQKAFRAEDVVAILGKTEGNGGVNDYTRGLATLCFQLLLSQRSDVPVEKIAKRVPIIWSGGTEGLMSPHATIFVREPDRGAPSGERRFTVGTAYTRDLLPEEFGTLGHAQVAAEGARAAIADAGIESSEDIHFVQIKTGALTTERIAEARGRGRDVLTTDTGKSMAYGDRKSTRLNSSH